MTFGSRAYEVGREDGEPVFTVTNAGICILSVYCNFRIILVLTEFAYVLNILWVMVELAFVLNILQFIVKFVSV